ncbi:hypothetical protein TSUD_84270 [Trifolium subterraneum]|uniref:Uncharacterized protein n=1 Tax=Trifolium subterraneum TaxID=3900 RepID=A0A2Z6P3T1_TRISU|nr:hypothetical protein TSUD_84270 [Trifolium subterraneum]
MFSSLLHCFSTFLPSFIFTVVLRVSILLCSPSRTVLLLPQTATLPLCFHSQVLNPTLYYVQKSITDVQSEIVVDCSAIQRDNTHFNPMEVLDKLRKFIDDAREGDTLIFVFSGISLSNGKPNLYLGKDADGRRTVLDAELFDDILRQIRHGVTLYMFIEAERASELLEGFDVDRAQLQVERERREAFTMRAIDDIQRSVLLCTEARGTAPFLSN